MSSAIATEISVLIIAGLFWLDSNPRARTSWALWVPTIWNSIACSRSVAQWLDTPAFDTPDQVAGGEPDRPGGVRCLIGDWARHSC